MVDFMEDVYFHDAPKKSLLIVDSWSSWKDEAAMHRTVRSGYEFQYRILPPHTTPVAQPLDVGIFKTWKSFDKYISDYVLLYDLDVKLHDRENVFKIQGLIHHQIGAPRFRNFIRFAWYKAGYVDEKPPPYVTPMKYCFGNLPENCDFCEHASFIRCALCEQILCFEHFFIRAHFCG